jgi:hypothetical protein
MYFHLFGPTMTSSEFFTFEQEFAQQYVYKPVIRALAKKYTDKLRDGGKWASVIDYAVFRECCREIGPHLQQIKGEGPGMKAR